MKPAVFVLTGPTGSGKTSLALALAHEYPIEIVSADTLQVFRKMDIGTAKPSVSERGNIPHHLIDELNPDEGVNASWYAAKARKAIDEIYKKGKLPLIVGGAGFYLRALEHPPVTQRAEEDIEVLEDAHALLSKEDPVAAAKIHPNDRYRLGRAVGLLKKGKKPSQEWRNTSDQEAPFPFEWFGVQTDREELYSQIEKRVDAMYRDGLIDETQSVLAEFPRSRWRLGRAIGYRQSLELLEKRTDFRTATEETKVASRQYAKRQLTWLRREPRIQWQPRKEILNQIRERIEHTWHP